MKPIYRNLLGLLISAIYVQLGVSLCDWSVRRNYMSLIISRKTVHMAAASLCMLNSLVFDTSHWTWILNSAVPAVYFIKLIVKGLILADPNDPDVKTMSRTGQVHVQHVTSTGCYCLLLLDLSHRNNSYLVHIYLLLLL